MQTTDYAGYIRRAFMDEGLQGVVAKMPLERNFKLDHVKEVHMPAGWPRAICIFISKWAIAISGQHFRRVNFRLTAALRVKVCWSTPGPRRWTGSDCSISA